jgi:hypothetical protein
MLRSAAIDAMIGAAQYEKRSMNEARRRLYHDLVLAGYSDPVADVREGALIALQDLGTSGDLPMLRRLAEGDTSTYRNTAGVVSYPIRDLAKKAIAKIPPK